MTRQLLLPSVPESVADAFHFLEGVVHDTALPPALGDRLLLAASEAVANAIEHGNGTEPARRVRLAWTPLADGGTLEVEDEGPGLARERILGAELPEDPYRTGGRGLFLIRELTDAFEVEGPCLRLQFRLRPGERP